MTRALLAPLGGALAIWTALHFWPGARTEAAVASFIAAHARATDLVVVTPAGSLDRLRPYLAAGLPAVSADTSADASAPFTRTWLVGELTRAAPPVVAAGWRATEWYAVADTIVILAIRVDAP